MKRAKKTTSRRSKIDKSKLEFGERERIRDEKHRRFIASLPCCRTLAWDVQCAHISHENGKGTALKVGDNNCVPLSCAEHLRQGDGEVTYWGHDLARAKRLANNLYAITGDREAAMFLIMKFVRGE